MTWIIIVLLIVSGSPKFKSSSTKLPIKNEYTGGSSQYDVLHAIGYLLRYVKIFLSR
jgi:hypothetical protein